MTKHNPKDHGLSRQAVAAAELVRALGEDRVDADLVHDMVEGETGFFEAVERALDEIGDCEILAVGIKELQGKLSQRLSRTERRAERLRGLIDQAFQMAEVKTHVFPAATVTTKTVPPKLIITDEAAIPAKFYEPQPPKLNRKALTDAAKIGPVTGAEMSNGGVTIQIRRA
jgi:hypothetical protein